MNASEIKFGIEFETTMPVTDRTPVGGYHRGVAVAWLPEGWKAERDSSIQTSYNRKAVEFVSPVLQGAEGLRSVETAISAIYDRGGRVNPTCGVHVTVEWNGDAAALARLLCLVSNHEKAIYASTGTKNRERGTWCKGVKKYGNDKDAKAKCDRERYHLVNLTHLANGRNRIEFRAFAGTLNVAKAIGHILMCLALVEMALSSKRRTAWNWSKNSSSYKTKDSGDGQRELNRFFYRMGWTKGYRQGAMADKKFGAVDGHATDWKAIKAKLTEMSKKYDARP